MDYYREILESTKARLAENLVRHEGLVKLRAVASKLSHFGKKTYAQAFEANVETEPNPEGWQQISAFLGVPVSDFEPP